MERLFTAMLVSALLLLVVGAIGAAVAVAEHFFGIAGSVAVVFVVITALFWLALATNERDQTNGR